MKRKVINTVLGIIIILLIIGIVAYYIYDVVCNETPLTDKLFKALSVVIALLGTLVKVFSGNRRRSLGFYEKAYHNELEYSFRNNPKSRKKLIQALRLYNESNYDKSLKYLFQVYSEAENSHDAVTVLLFIALCYTDMGLTEEAIKTYYKLLERDCRNVRAHSNLGLLYVDEGNFKMALSHYNESIECEPNNYYAYSNRANCYFKQADYENAISDAKKALEIKNNGHEAASLLAIIYALLGDEQNKEKYFKVCVANGKNPDDVQAAIEYYLKAKV